MISYNASMTPKQIVKDAPSDQVFGWQLYAKIDKGKREDMLVRMNKLDAIKVVCLTLDALVPGKREDDERSKNIVESNHSSLLKDARGHELKGGDGIGQSLFFGKDPSLTWSETLPWLAKHTNKPIIFKGLQTHEDAYLVSQPECPTGEGDYPLESWRASGEHRAPFSPHPPGDPEVIAPRCWRRWMWSSTAA